MSQNFANHGRMVPGFHYITSLLVTGSLVIAAIKLVNAFTSGETDVWMALYCLLVALALIGLFWYTRSFALRAQDRAIRAEENFRHFVLTGKRLPDGLRLGQIIALRFAPDEEFVELAAKAAQEKMKPVDIKKSIRQWRADYHRV